MPWLVNMDASKLPRLVRLLLRLGYRRLHDPARAARMTVKELTDLATGMRPATENGEWTPEVLRLSEETGFIPEDLFPDAAGEVMEPGFFSTVPEPDAVAEYRDLVEQTTKVLATLPERGERVLRMRFGLGRDREEEDHTLDEVGEIFGVSPERVRQIESKALRMLRHPSRSKRLNVCVSPVPTPRVPSDEQVRVRQPESPEDREKALMQALTRWRREYQERLSESEKVCGCEECVRQREEEEAREETKACPKPLRPRRSDPATEAWRARHTQEEIEHWEALGRGEAPAVELEEARRLVVHLKDLRYELTEKEALAIVRRKSEKRRENERVRRVKVQLRRKLTERREQAAEAQRKANEVAARYERAERFIAALQAREWELKPGWKINNLPDGTAVAAVYHNKNTLAAVIAEDGRILVGGVYYGEGSALCISPIDGDPFRCL